MLLSKPADGVCARPPGVCARPPGVCARPPDGVGARDETGERARAVPTLSSYEQVAIARLQKGSLAKISTYASYEKIIETINV